MSKVKQVLAGVLSASMIVTLLPAVTFAAPTSISYTNNTGATVSAATLEEAIAGVGNEGTITVSGGTIDTNVVLNKSTGFSIVLTDGASLASGVEIAPDDTLHACFIKTDNSFTYHPAHKFTGADGIVSSKTGSATTADIHITCQYGCEGVDATATGSATPVKSEGGYNYYEGTVDSGDSTTQWIYDRYVADVDPSAKVTYREEIAPATITYRVDNFNYQKTTPENMATSSPVSFYANLQSSSDGTTYADVKNEAGKVETVAGTITQTNRLTEAQIDDLVAQAATGMKVYVANAGADGVAAEAVAGNYVADAAATANTYGTHSYQVSFTLGAAYGGATTTIYIVNVRDEAKLDAVKNGVGKFQALYADEDGNEKWVDFELTTGKDAVFNFTADTETGKPVVTDAATGTKYYLVLTAEGNFTYRPVFISTKDATDAQIAAGDAINGKAAIYGENETYVRKSNSVKKSCGTATFNYDPKTVSYKNEASGNVEASALSVGASISLTGNDTHTASNIDSWAVAYTNTATHEATGEADVVCKVCNNTYHITFPKKNQHTFILAPGSINAKVTSVAATCLYPSFNYKECSASNGVIANVETVDNWYTTDGTNYSYKLTLNKSKNWYYTFSATIASGKATIKDAAGNVVEKDIATLGDTVTDICWHPVAESIGSAVGTHSLRLKAAPAAPEWGYGDSVALADKKLTDDVTVKVEEECEDCGKAFTYVYHKQTYDEYKAAYVKTHTSDPNANLIPIKLDNGSTDTATLTNEIHVFGKVTYTVTVGADCTKANKFVYSVADVVPGKTISSNAVNSNVYYGPHSYKNSVVWAENGESAKVLQQCSKACTHEDLDGNKKSQTIDAVVTSADNADGSTTYTATLEGQTLTDNTKTVINLAKAEVVVNGGNEVDLNNYDRYDIEALTTVTINGAAIDPKEWTIEGSALVVGNNTVKVVPETATDDYTPIAVNSKEVTFKCSKLPTLEIATVKFDGNLSTSTAYDDSITYDTKAHPFEVTVKDTKTKRAVADAKVEYLAISEYDSISTRNLDKLEFADALSLTEAGTYTIIVKMSKEGYSTQYAVAAGDERDAFVDAITINQYDTGAVLTVNKQILTYGEELIATTGDDAINTMIGLTTADTKKMNVGVYDFYDLVKWDQRNYYVDTNLIGAAENITIEKRNATIVLTEDSSTYNGQPVDKSGLFTIDGAVNGDTLNVIVNTAGNKEILNAGEYTLVATANDANYNIDKVTAVYTVKPASIVGMTVTPKKTSMVWTGKARKPGVKSVVSGDGVALTTADYSVSYSNNINAGKNAKMIVKGKGNYTGSITTKFTITKAKQKVKSTTPATGKTKTYTATALKKANKTFTIKATASKEQGTAQFKKVSGNAKITLTSAGKVTVKKGLAKGTYTLKYKVRIKATKNCKATAYVNKTVKIKVK